MTITVLRHHTHLGESVTKLGDLGFLLLLQLEIAALTSMMKHELLEESCKFLLSNDLLG